MRAAPHTVKARGRVIHRTPLRAAGQKLAATGTVAVAGQLVRAQSPQTTPPRR